jgi:hypothetical protein
MVEIKQLKTAEQLELEQWIATFEIPKTNFKKWNRQFADSCLLVEIIKKIYPKLVDQHNYSPQNSTTLKLKNWTTLNRKVLKKLDIWLSDEILKRLATADNGVINVVLNEVMQKVKALKESGSNSSVLVDTDNGENNGNCIDRN